jgi:hypothetical protein
MPALPELPVLTVSLACTPLPTESVPPTLPDASGCTEVVDPIVWAFDAVEYNANNIESATAGTKLRIRMACLP